MNKSHKTANYFLMFTKPQIGFIKLQIFLQSVAKIFKITPLQRNTWQKVRGAKRSSWIDNAHGQQQQKIPTFRKGDRLLWKILRNFSISKSSKMAHFLGQFTTQYVHIWSKSHTPGQPARKNEENVHLRFFIFESSSDTFELWLG